MQNNCVTKEINDFLNDNSPADNNAISICLYPTEIPTVS